MIALDQTRGTLLRAQRMLVCLMLAGVAGLGHAQDGAVKTGSQEGTLVVNYYSTAPDPNSNSCVVWRLMRLACI